MAQTRKDLRGRVLRKGESQRRSDGRYVYTYTDPLGRRNYVYAQDLVVLQFLVKSVSQEHFDEVFGRSTVMELLELKGSGASKLLSNLVQADIIEPVSGHGKGKYKFKRDYNF